MKGDRKILFNTILKYSSNHVYTHIKAKRKRIFFKVKYHSKFLPFDAKFTEKMYVYLYKLTKRPKCNCCSEPVNKFYSFSRGYSTFCSTKCVANSKEVFKLKFKNLK